MSGQSSAEKTEKPTPKKKQDARKKGQVSQSKEITTGISIISLVVYYYINNSNIKQDFESIYEIVFYAINHINFNDLNINGIFDQVLSTLSTLLIKVIIIPITIASAASCTTSILQIKGIIFSAQSIIPKFDKLNPVTNAKNLFSKKNLVKFFKNVVQVVILSIISVQLFKSNLVDILLVPSTSLNIGNLFLEKMILKTLIILLACSLIFGIFDLIMEKRNLNKQLMMDKEELKEEYKNTEGNPEVKSERKRLHQELLESEQLDYTLDDATMVLANPTHIAIVIIYSPSRWARPRVILKRKGYQAQIVFSIAQQKNIPIIRDKWLARSIYDMVELGEFIPNRFLFNISDLISRNIDLFPKVVTELQNKYKSPNHVEKI